MTFAKTATAVLAAILLSAALAGCGKKGRLEPPEGSTSEFPRVYPKPEVLRPPRARPPQPPQPAEPEDYRIEPPRPMENRVPPP